MPQPLEGIRVLEWGIFHAGPGGNAILGDLGAEVIKIEQPGSGDPVRGQKHFGHASFEIPGGKSLFFEAANRNKKSITLDLSKQAGREAAYRLVAKCDVFATNLRKSTVQGFHMDYQTLSAFNPSLVYASVSAYGPNGPDADRGGFDFHGQARSGLMFCMGEPEMPPLVLHFGMIDQATAIMASHQIITALLARQRFGVGQEVNVSILGSAIYLAYIDTLCTMVFDREVERHKRTDCNPLRNHYLCQDGKWMMIGLGPHTQELWPDVCRLLGLPDLADDFRFNSDAARLKNARELIQMFDAAFASRPRQEWLKLFGERGLISCQVNRPLELADDPQVIQNGYLVDFDHPDLGRIKVPGYPVHFSQGPAGTRSFAPGLGQHTDEVLQSLGGYSTEEIARLRQEGVV